MVLGHHHHGHLLPEFINQASRIVIRLIPVAVEHLKTCFLQNPLHQYELLLKWLRCPASGPLIIRIQLPAEGIPCLVKHKCHIGRLLLFQQGNHGLQHPHDAVGIGPVRCVEDFPVMLFLFLVRLGEHDFPG